MNTIEQLREIRSALPKGKKDPWGNCCPSKRVLLHRLLHRAEITEGTDGELTVLNEFLEHVKKVKKENKAYEMKVAQIIKKTQQ